MLTSSKQAISSHRLVLGHQVMHMASQHFLSVQSLHCFSWACVASEARRIAQDTVTQEERVVGGICDYQIAEDSKRRLCMFECFGIRTNSPEERHP